MHEQLIVTEQLESHLLQGPSPALKPICSMQTPSACQETNVATNGKADSSPGWLVLLPALSSSYTDTARNAPQSHGTWTGSAKGA